MSRLWENFGGIIKTAIAGITIGMATKAITDFAAKGDEISDLSKRFMMTGDAIQEFQYAAKAADLTSEDLTSIIQKMNNNMGQLSQGTGTLFSFLKKANPQLALQLLHTKDSEKAFSMLMDAISAETDVQKRAALAQAAFGKSGQPVIDMAGDLNAKRAEARRLGLIIPRADVEAAAEMHANLIKLGASAGGFFNVVLARAVKVLGPLLIRFDRWLAINRELIGQKIERVINAIVSAVKFAYNIFTRWWPVIALVVWWIVAMNVAMKAALLIQVVSKAFAVASAVMAMFRAGASLATVAQWALNVAMDANPIGLIIIGLTALIVVVILMIKYWKEITTALREAWNWFNELLGNPWIRIALSIIAEPLLIIYGIIKTIVDLIQGKGISAFKNLIDAAGPLYSIGNAIANVFGGGIKPNGGRILAPGEGQTTGMGALRAVENKYAAPGTRAMETKTTREERSTKDFMLHLPKGFGISTQGGPVMDEYSSDLGEQ
jgi:hypothetical protein